ncbi:MAG: phosphate propanoyltransferase [Oscillospiraceae bacterium]|nr:phosphate propanoyltransferase [Oscillospiraceae bacterium]
MAKIEVIVEGSGKHCHLTRETLDIVYGKGFEMEVKKWLSQPGQFATPHKVTIVGPKGQTTMSILGPCRKADQVELSFTDARSLGLECPIRESGDLAGSPGCKIIGPCGEVDIKEGCIIAKRHIHLTPEDAEKFGIKDKQIVKVKVGGERALIFDEVVARVSKDYATFIHIDYDEVNAAALFWKDPLGEVIL